MINRVTHQTVQASTLANLQLNLGKMSDLQAKLSGGKNITRPSDDPGGTASTLQLRASQRAAEQYSRNTDDALGWLTTVDSALQASVAALRQARDLTVRGANEGSLGQTSRDAIAVELEGIRDAMLAQANTTYLGRSVFAGTSNEGVAFRPDFTWSGQAGASVERRLASDTTVRADADGSAVFGEGATSVFALIDTIAADLRSGTNVGPRLNEIDAHLETMLGELAAAGTRYAQAEAAQSASVKTLMDLKGQISAIEDIDLAATLVDIQSQEVAYQAALGATARVLQPSLMDFLR
ncbi:flagellar hook-associated protein 3 [Cellulomonas sp. APG4]|uniref:flagellar hook-associated protein FlgL n=1 Tax=Cellulomonas sp. APG4 TaxID=1538656 RepID=UPI00137B878D|nr:flagellar hook-associated protein 3 [Cellulomonas sp. APG4]